MYIVTIYDQEKINVEFQSDDIEHLINEVDQKLINLNIKRRSVADIFRELIDEKSEIMQNKGYFEAVNSRGINIHGGRIMDDPMRSIATIRFRIRN